MVCQIVVKKCSFLIFTFLLHLSLFSLEVNLISDAAILINAETGAILFEKNSSQKFYPASITKIATALYALNQVGNDLELDVEAKAEAIASILPSAKRKSNYKMPSHWVEVASNHIAIKKGEVLSLKSLLYAMMLESANDASNVIAQYVGGTISNFVKEVNSYLKYIGCKETNFTNAHGLHHPDHQTSARDMALIARTAMQNPIFREIVATVKYSVPASNKQPTRVLIQHNALLKKGSLYYPKATGIKTGGTSDALSTLVASAKHGDRSLIAVVLHCSKAKDTFVDVKNLFEAAFQEEKHLAKLINSGLQSYTLKMKGSDHLLKTYSKEDVAFSYYPSEVPKIKMQLKWNELSLPIEKDASVGSLLFTNETGATLKELVLYAQNSVGPSLSHRIESSIEKWKKKGLFKWILVGGIACLFLGIGWWVKTKKA